MTWGKAPPMSEKQLNMADKTVHLRQTQPLSTAHGIEAERGSAADVTRQAVIKLFDDTRKRLVETGTRNRLVHVNRANTRGNVLNIVNERSDDVYALLSGGKIMRFA